MIEGLLALLVCQVLGTGIAESLHLRIPGPVLGMLLMLGYLFVRRPADDSPVLRTGDRLLTIMPLLFIPAGVGVVAWLGAIRAAWLPIGVSMVVPWAAGLLVTGGVASLVMRGLASEDPLPDGDALVHEAEDVEGVDPEAGR